MGSSSKGRRTKRGILACVSCRGRKVRCNVIEQFPCVNCRMRDAECHVHPGRRQYAYNRQLKPRVDSERLSQKTGNGSEDGSMDWEDSPCDEFEWFLASSDESDRMSADVLSMDGWTPDFDTLAFLNGGMSAERYYEASPNLKDMGGSSIVLKDHVKGSKDASDHPSHPFRLLGIPPIIKPPSERCSSLDAWHIISRGVFDLPTTETQTALVEAYIWSVHSRFPILTAECLVNMVSEEAYSSPSMSFLVYRCVLYAAAAFVDWCFLQKAGYMSRKAARRDLHEKAKLLYTWDIETDRLAIVQSLLLLSGADSVPEEPKNSWHWVGLAINTAQSINPSLKQRCSESLTPIQSRLWWRLWWLCFMFDHLIALGLRYPCRLGDEFQAVDQLDHADFDDFSGLNTIAVPQNSCLRYFMEQAQDLAAVCIARAKLCQCISLVLKVQYTTLSPDLYSYSTSGRCVMVTPKATPAGTSEVRSTHSTLTKWARSIPEFCDATRITALPESPAKAQCILLHMEFHTLVSALFRPYFLMSSLKFSAQDLPNLESARFCVTKSADQISQLLEIAMKTDLQKTFPSTSVAIVFTSGIIHLANLSSFTEDGIQSSLVGLRRCLGALMSLKDAYIEAEYAENTILSMISKATSGATSDLMRHSN